MATINTTIALIAKVVENKTVSGTTDDGVDFAFNKLTLLAGNGMHWEYAVARQGADDATEKVFKTAKKDQYVKLTGCFLKPFVTSKGTACVQVLAKHAEFVK
jgi:hypothetical protein